MDRTSSRPSLGGGSRIEKSGQSNKETSLMQEIKVLELTLKELPYMDMRVDAQNAEEIVGKAVKDLTANLEEHQEIKEMIRQIEKEIKDLEEKGRGYRRPGISSRKKDFGSTMGDEQSWESKKLAKMGVLKKLQQVKSRNEEQKTLITRFLVNLCKQGKRAEYEEKVAPADLVEA